MIATMWTERMRPVFMHSKGLSSHCWAAMWRQRNKLDGIRLQLIYSECCTPVLFRTRKDAKAWIDREYGYIRSRADLRKEPHGWRMPVPVKVTVAP